MTAEQLYEWMIKSGVREPAVIKLGDRHIAGRWETIGEVTPDGHILAGERKAIQVLGTGPSWDKTYERTLAALFPVKGDSRAPAKPGEALPAPTTIAPAPDGRPF